MIAKGTMISVPAQVLQDLIWNYELNSAWTGPTSRCEELMEKQCEALQVYLTDADIDPDAAALEGFSFEEFDNVEFVNFRKRV
jgi:hypothetical protein